VLVSGNFFNLFDYYYPLEPKVDLIITEMRNTRYRQPTWYRYVAGFAAGKPVIVVENPYGGVVPELVEKLKAGRGYDLFRMSLYEAAALGANMSLPYGSWMGSVIQDSFYAPHGLCVEIQSFLAEHDHLYSPRTFSETAVIYSIESNAQLVARRDLFADNRANISGDQVIPFWEVTGKLAGAAQPYDVIFFPEGVLRPDTLTVEDLAQYHTLILPDCRSLTTYQAQLLASFLEKGGGLLVLGELGMSLPEAERAMLVDHPRTTRLPGLEGFNQFSLPGGPQVALLSGGDLAIHVQRVAGGAAVHIIRYDYDEAQDRVALIPGISFDLRLAETFYSLDVFSPNGSPQASMQVSGNIHHIDVRDVGLYTVLLLKR
jgi:hypothetical protein